LEKIRYFFGFAKFFPPALTVLGQNFALEGKKESFRALLLTSQEKYYKIFTAKSL